MNIPRNGDLNIAILNILEAILIHYRNVVCSHKSYNALVDWTSYWALYICNWSHIIHTIHN